MTPITFVLRDFAEWTSIPGPIQIIYALNSFIRFLWVVIWLTLFAIFVYQFYLIIEKLFEQDSQIDISFNFEKQRFPNVIICNENTHKLSAVMAFKEYQNIAHLMDDYVKLFRENGNISGNFLFKNASTQFQKEVWVSEILRIISTEMNFNYSRMKSSYMLEDIIQYCSFNGKICNREDFTVYVDDYFGVCFRFNAINRSSMFISRSGASNGLQLIITNMRTTVKGDSQYLPVTKFSGIRYSIDNNDEFPFMDTFGKSLMPGYEHNIAMKLYETTLMPAPYGHCVYKVNEKIYNFYESSAYTLSNCLRSCKQQRFINHCGCADPHYRASPNVPRCGVNEQCLINLRRQLGSYVFNALRDCNCPPPCHKFTIEKELSSLKFKHHWKIFGDNKTDSLPKSSRQRRQNFLLREGQRPNRSLFSHVSKTKNMNLIHSGDNQESLVKTRKNNIYWDISCSHTATIQHFAGNATLCHQWFRQNALVLNLFYKSLNVEKRTQKSSYSISQASNDLGGQVSLWLGASVISVIEIITLVLMITIFFIHGRNVRVIPTADEYNKDARYRDIQKLKTELDVHERMDQELVIRIDKHRRSENARRIELEQQLQEAEMMHLRAKQEAQTKYAIFCANPTNPHDRGVVANAQTVLQATKRHLHNIREMTNEYF